MLYMFAVMSTGIFGLFILGFGIEWVLKKLTPKLPEGHPDEPDIGDPGRQIGRW